MNEEFLERVKTVIAGVACVSLLGGCAAPVAYGIIAATGGAQGSMIYGGAQDHRFTLTVDESTVTPEVRDSLSTANHWALLADGKSDAITADTIESRGVRVTVHRVPVRVEAMTTRERRANLDKMCETIAPDIALLFHSTNWKETGTFGQALLGRSENTSMVTTHVLRCSDNVLSTFRTTAVLNLGNSKDAANLQEALNREFGNRILVIAGRSDANASSPAEKPEAQRVKSQQ